MDEGKDLTRDSCHTRTQMELLMSAVISTSKCIITQCYPTNHMRSQSMQTYRLQGFWGFPALLFVILEILLTICLLVANRIHDKRISWGLRASTECCQGLIQQMSLSILNCSSFLCCTPSGEHVVTSEMFTYKSSR